MTANPAPVTGRAQALREAFDRSFAQPPPPEIARAEEFLAIRVAGDAYALRIGEIAGLFADKVVTPLPGEVPHLLGVSGLRGSIVPVYDLGALLGYAARAAGRWLVLARSNEPVALALDAFEGQLVLSPREVVSGPGERPHARGIALTPGGARPVVHLSSVLDDIRKRVTSTRFTRKEG